MNIKLFEPNFEDYWYEQEILNDPKTMNYNAGYDLNLDRYDYNTGCIKFPKELWKSNYNDRKINNKFFAYIKDADKNLYIGTANYQFNKKSNKYECGVVIEAKYRGKGYSKIALKLLVEHAFEHGVNELYDDFEDIRLSAVKVFSELGFKKVDEFNYKKFNKGTKVSVFKLTKGDFYENNRI